LDRFANFLQGRGHPQAGRLQRSSLIVVEDAAHGRTVVEHHATGRIGLRLRRVRRPHGDRHRGLGIVSGCGLRRLGTLPLEHGLFDLSQAAHLLAHLDFGVAVGLQHGLGHVAEEVHRPNAIDTLRTTIVIPFRSSTRRFIPHLSNRSWLDAE
jgi:hypothetical protein